jgi:hypothetical protein
VSSLPPADPGPGAAGPGPGAAGPGPGAEAGRERSLGEIIGDITGDLGTLMRQELDLAKTEIKQEAAKAGKGAGLLGGAGVTGHMALLFASLTLMFALRQALDSYVWAALIVTVLWAVVAAVLAAQGRKKLKTVQPKPDATIQTLKEDAQWAKTATRND